MAHNGHSQNSSECPLFPIADIQKQAENDCFRLAAVIGLCLLESDNKDKNNKTDKNDNNDTNGKHNKKKDTHDNNDTQATIHVKTIKHDTSHQHIINNHYQFITKSV